MTPQPARSSGLSAFRYRNYSLYWISQVTTNVGSWMQIVATGWLVLQITDSPAYLGYNAAFQAFPILFFALVGGVVADRFDRYKLTVAAYVVQIVPDAILAWLVISGNIRVEHVFAYSVVTATINGLSTPARQAFVPRLVPKEALLSAMSLNAIVWQGAAVIGPAVAGMILAGWSLPGSFNINVASDLLSLVAIVLVRVPPLTQDRPVARRGGAREGLAYVWRNRHVRALLVSIAVVTFLSRPYSQLMPAFARDVFQVGPQGLGWLLTVPAIGTVTAGVLLTLVRRAPLVRVFLLSSIAVTAALLGFCATRSFPLALGLLFVVGGGSTTATTAVNTMLQEAIDERLRGRVMSFYMAATWGAWRLGSLPVGIASQAWGAPLGVGAAAALLAILLVPTARSQALRGGSRPPALPPDPLPQPVPAARTA